MPLLERMTSVIEQMAAPRELVRDSSGQITGIKIQKKSSAGDEG
jgi:hypothetical protein